MELLPFFKIIDMLLMATRCSYVHKYQLTKRHSLFTDSYDKPVLKCSSNTLLWGVILYYPEIDILPSLICNCLILTWPMKARQYKVKYRTSMSIPPKLRYHHTLCKYSYLLSLRYIYAIVVGMIYIGCFRLIVTDLSVTDTAKPTLKTYICISRIQ